MPVANRPRVESLADALASDRAALTVTEAAAVSQVNRRTIMAGIESGAIHAVRFGHNYLIPRQPFLALITGEALEK